MPTMNPITSRELTALRTEVAAGACDTSCVIKRPTNTSDGRLTNTVVYNTIATVNAGMKQPSAAQSALFASRIGSQTAWRVMFAYGTDVQPGDHLVMGSTTMVVEADLTPQSYSVLSTFLAVTIQ